MCALHKSTVQQWYIYSFLSASLGRLRCSQTLPRERERERKRERERRQSMHQDICLGPIVPVTAVDIHLRQELRQPPGSSRIAGYKSLRGGLCFGHGRLALTKVTWHGCNHIYIYIYVCVCEHLWNKCSCPSNPKV